MAEQQGTGWRERRKEAKRVKAERTGDTPQKQREPSKPGEMASVKDNIERAGTGGFLGGGF